MLKELGTVSIRYHEGMYGASCDGVMQYGEFPEGAVWNVLRVKRESAAGRGAKTNGQTANASEFGYIPEAGQESY